MRIIVDNGAYTLRNMGDVAMLQALLKRIKAVYPTADCHVLTSAPNLLPRYCPDTHPLAVNARDAAFLPEEKVQGPGAWKIFWKRLRGKKTPARANASDFLRIFENADRLVVAGGGFINDLNFKPSLAILRQVEAAAKNGKVPALFGQGLGPLENPSLLMPLAGAARAGTWFGLREPLKGPATVEGAGAESSRVAVTGDDAIEEAWQARSKSSQPANALGFSIRQIAYSGVDKHAELLAEVIGKLSHRFNAKIQPVPVSFNPWENDPAAISLLTRESCNIPDSPSAIIEAASRCRVMLTGTYHAAVFALAQGIPCVCFYSAQYYKDKLDGLAAQFGTGCEAVDLSRTDARERLIVATEKLWEQAAQLRDTLCDAAGRQAELARQFTEKALRSS